MYQGLKVQDLNFRVGGKQILHSISFFLAPEQTLAIIGPSGCGKSTLLKSIAQINRSYTGLVEVLHPHAPYHIGFVPQDDVVHGSLTVYQELSYACSLRYRQSESAKNHQINSILRLVKLSERKDLKINKLSGGQRKRVSVALELLGMSSQPLLLLDEPTAGLDPGLEKEMMQLLNSLKKPRKNILLTTHLLTHLDLCDQVIVLSEGWCCYIGPPSQLQSYFKIEKNEELYTKLRRRKGEQWYQDFSKSKLYHDMNRQLK